MPIGYLFCKGLNPLVYRKAPVESAAFAPTAADGSFPNPKCVPPESLVQPLSVERPAPHLFRQLLAVGFREFSGHMSETVCMMGDTAGLLKNSAPCQGIVLIRTSLQVFLVAFLKAERPGKASLDERPPGQSQ